MKNVKEKKEIAQALYYQRQTMKDIAEKLNVSERTVHSWAKKESWKERRAAQSISRNAIVSKILRQIDELSECEDINADKIIKLSKALEKIDQKNNLADYMRSFLDFIDWLKQEQQRDKQITSAFVIKLIALQEKFENQLR